MAMQIAENSEPIPGYRLIRLLGRGGFGEVWLAQAPGDFTVALKFVRLNSDAARPELNALKLLKVIRHPHLLDIQFARLIDNDNWLAIAMPLCDQNLAERLGECARQGLPGIPPQELLGYMTDAARALDHLNEHRHDLGDGARVGVQHRDIKPQNLLLVGGSVRVADFGLAKALEGSRASHSGGWSLAYGPPELFQDKVSDATDQYSLAVTYYQLRTQRLPFEGNQHAVMFGHLHKEPDLTALPVAEQAVVRRALHKQAHSRWPNCQEFVAELLACQAPPRPARRAPEANEAPQVIRPAPGIATLPDPNLVIANSLGMQFAWIKPGTFLMGSPPNEEQRERYEGADETQHRVTLTKGYYLGIHAVTRGQFATFVQATNYRTEAETRGGAYGLTGTELKLDPKRNWRSPGFEQTEAHPLVCISWNDAKTFCDWLVDEEGKRYSLPTEAQWEFACRAGTTTPFHFGNTLSTDQANYDGNYTYGKGKKGVYRKQTTPVGSFPANAWKLHDMHGNVWEWCSDWFGDYPSGDVDDPEGPESGGARVLRGGSWYRLAEDCRAASRNWGAPGGRSDGCGLRVCFRLD